MKIKHKKYVERAAKRRALIALIMVLGALIFITVVLYMPPM